MINITGQMRVPDFRHTHSDRLERWLGAEAVQRMSDAARAFYWPIPVHGVGGAVYAMPGGDFVGEIRGGQEMSAIDRAQDSLRRFQVNRRAAVAQHRITMTPSLRNRMDRRQHAFASLSALIAAATGGKAKNLIFSKTGVASNAIGNSNELWTRAGQPSAGAAGAAAPGGTATIRTTTGSWGYVNPETANGGHFVTGHAAASVINNTLLLIDQLFRVAKTINSTATEAVTGTFARYQSQTATDENYIGGNFVFPANPTTVLAATAHNWTVCQYRNQANAAANIPSVAGVSACVVGGIDLAAGQTSWFMPLAAGDVGVKNLTQMQASALVATGTIDFVVAHAIAFFPCPIANLICPVDGINTAFNLTRIYDDACLTAIEMPKPATTATSYSGQITAVGE